MSIPPDTPSDHEGHVAHEAHVAHEFHTDHVEHEAHEAHEAHVARSAVEGPGVLDLPEEAHAAHLGHLAHEGHVAHEAHQAHVAHEAHEAHEARPEVNNTSTLTLERLTDGVGVWVLTDKQMLAAVRLAIYQGFTIVFASQGKEEGDEVTQADVLEARNAALNGLMVLDSDETALLNATGHILDAVFANEETPSVEIVEHDADPSTQNAQA